MGYPQFLFVCWCSSIFAVTSCIRVDGHSCVSAYWDTISCVLNITENPSNTTYSLDFTDLDNSSKIYRCELLWMNHSLRSDCKVTEPKRNLSVRYKYAIQLCNESNCQSLTSTFKPSENIQPTSPYDVNIQQTPGAFNITWKSGYEGHMYLTNILDYEVLLQSFQSNKNKPFTRTLYCKSPEKSALIPRSHLKLYDKYCIEVRSKVNFPDYRSLWSQWSLQTCWENDEVQKENEKTSVTWTKVLAPLCVVFGVLLFVFSSPAARMKIKTLSQTPSPAPFFQPLYQQYEGNLQDWLSPQSKCTPIHKTEEMLTTNAVTVVPKPMKKDPEESLDVQGSSVAQLAFTHCQSCYVVLPVKDKGCSPITMVCPGDTSYTQLPCSTWGLNPEEVQVMPSPPRDSLEISCSDSGCSFDSLTESPHCSLPTSPVVDSSPLFHCNDYCILNKTAEGVVPVLVTKGSSQNTTSDTHQEDKS